MNWLMLSVAALGIAALAVHRYRPWLEQLLRPTTAGGASKTALRRVTALDAMIETLRHENDPMKRHRLLREVVDETHRQRSDPAMRKLFLRFATMHVQELPQMAEAFKRSQGGKRPDGSVFTLLAAALDEDGRAEEAVSVRKQAAAAGWIDEAPMQRSGARKKREKKIGTRRPSEKPANRSRTRGAR
jgi:hypothetical protein